MVLVVKGAVNSNYTRCFRGLFQYGLLHFGQTRGSPTVPLRGTHSCLQREQR